MRDFWSGSSRRAAKMKRVSYYGTIFSPFTVLRSLAMLASPPTPAYPARVDLFVGLMRKRVRFHPVEVLVEPDGQFVIGDGHHRTAASLQCGYTHLPTLLYASQERRRVALPWDGVCRHKKRTSSGLVLGAFATHCLSWADFQLFRRIGSQEFP